MTKTFKGTINPAINFISQESIDNAEEKKEIKTANPPEGYKLNPLYVEKKTARLQLLMQPSLKEKLKSRAAAEGKSVNDLVNTIIAKALSDEE